jgi:uncharacterized protein
MLFFETSTAGILSFRTIIRKGSALVFKGKEKENMRMYKSNDVDDYIANSAAEARPVLKELREIVKSTIPDAEEGISWGVPFYRYHGLLTGFSALKDHALFGLVEALQGKVRKTLEKKGYTTGKKTIQIRFGQKAPSAEIKRIVKARAKMNAAKER